MRYLVTLWNGDVRECYLKNGYFVHVLNSSWEVGMNDPAIRSIKSCWGEKQDD